MPKGQFVLCDVFATGPLTGNQLAVFVESEGVGSPEMHALAREFNFSEITFTGPAAPDGVVPVRIFTPAAEIPFAGHPLLGTAAGLARAGGYQETMKLRCGVGPIDVELEWRDGRTAMVWMRQPVPTVQSFPHASALCDALGIHETAMPVEIYDNGMPHVYVALESEQEVASLHPDVRALVAVTAEHNIDAGINCFAGSGRTWKTRMFAPGYGVVEDPATGSAAGPLACHLVRHGLIRPGEEIEIRQGSEVGRPSLLRARADGTEEAIEGVRVGGVVEIVGGGSMEWQ